MWMCIAICVTAACAVCLAYGAFVAGLLCAAGSREQQGPFA